LADRSGLLCQGYHGRRTTAARISISNYNPHLRALSFTTKGNVRQTLPVTAEIAAAIEALPKNADPYAPIVNLLRVAKPGHTPGLSPRFTKQWKALKRKTNTRRPELRVHDLRRTLAENVWTEKTATDSWSQSKSQPRDERDLQGRRHPSQLWGGAVARLLCGFASQKHEARDGAPDAGA
jgi:integrase